MVDPHVMLRGFTNTALVSAPKDDKHRHIYTKWFKAIDISSLSQNVFSSQANEELVLLCEGVEV